MMTWKVTFGAIVLWLANAMPYSDSTSSAIRSLRNAGYKIEGRDPCDGTGFCCALLPAFHDEDVCFVTLPAKKWTSSQLRLLKHFEHLKQIRADRDVDRTEFDTLCEILGDRKHLLLLYVLNVDGHRIWTGP